ncbi:hypothetical protein [Marinoscillum luteum]|uniref:Uncharacterized protein n=1 Tax=Marinoscillum luteum TaxID=861051 RepID=A0ABW7N593_9BACT
MKKAIKIILIVILSLFIVLIIAWLTANEPLPEGEPGPRAEALADRMLLALNDSAYQNLELISWKYPRGPHKYDWYKQKDTVEVRWDNMRVLLCTTTLDGSAFLDNEALSGSEKEKALYTAWDFFANDSFWLIAPFKVRDPGTERKVVETDRGLALLVTYTSGGVTPGDSYLWILDENDRPIAWKFWVQKIPIGGLETSWGDWQQYKGVWLGTSHEVGPVEIKLEIQNIN